MYTSNSGYSLISKINLASIFESLCNVRGKILESPKVTPPKSNYSSSILTSGIIALALTGITIGLPPLINTVNSEVNSFSTLEMKLTVKGYF